MSICLRINAQSSIRSRYQCCCLYLRWFLLHGVHPQRPFPHFCEMWVSVGCHSLLQSHSSLLLLRQIDPLEPETDLQSLGSTSWFFEPRESSRPSSSTKYETTIFWSRARPLSNPACCPISTPRPINSSAPCLLTVICSLPQGKTTSHSNPDPGPCLHCPLGEPYASTFLFLSSWPMSAFWNPWISRITSLLKLFHHGPKSPLERFPILYITLNVYGSVPHIRGFSITKPPNLMRRVALGHL